jgi:hypothetical protein
MQIELHLADSIHKHKIKADAARLKMKKIKRNALEKEICCQQVAESVKLSETVNRSL